MGALVCAKAPVAVRAKVAMEVRKMFLIIGASEIRGGEDLASGNCVAKRSHANGDFLRRLAPRSAPAIRRMFCRGVHLSPHKGARG
jgi:hypothetical protein